MSRGATAGSLTEIHNGKSLGAGARITHTHTCMESNPIIHWQATPKNKTSFFFGVKYILLCDLGTQMQRATKKFSISKLNPFHTIYSAFQFCSSCKRNLYA